MRKPDPGIFKMAMRIAQASPQECIYFDDRLEFVELARELGIHSFQHQKFSETKKILESIKLKK
jgi:putative hydrolase of the HAD superfamily